MSKVYALCRVLSLFLAILRFVNNGRCCCCDYGFEIYARFLCESIVLSLASFTSLIGVGLKIDIREIHLETTCFTKNEIQCNVVNVQIMNLLRRCHLK